MNRTNLKKILGKQWEDLKRDSKTTYIICPDMNCEGFTKNRLQCKTTTFSESPSCPKKDIAYKILHCYEGHPNKLPLDYSSFRRVDCLEENCYAISFELMSGQYARIPLELIDEFLEKEFVKKD